MKILTKYSLLLSALFVLSCSLKGPKTDTSKRFTADELDGVIRILRDGAPILGVKPVNEGDSYHLSVYSKGNPSLFLTYDSGKIQPQQMGLVINLEDNSEEVLYISYDTDSGSVLDSASLQNAPLYLGWPQMK